MEDSSVPDPQYLPRVLDRELDSLLDGLPAVSLEGPKGVGKRSLPRVGHGRSSGWMTPTSGRSSAPTPTVWFAVQPRS